MEENHGTVPGRGQAIASLVLGIFSILLVWFGLSTIPGLACGIVGVFMAAGAKIRGYTGGMRSSGLVCSLVGAILCAVAFVACVACIAWIATDDLMSQMMRSGFIQLYSDIYPYLTGVTAGLLP